MLLGGTAALFFVPPSHASVVVFTPDSCFSNKIRCQLTRFRGIEFPYFRLSDGLQVTPGPPKLMTGTVGPVSNLFLTSSPDSGRRLYDRVCHEDFQVPHFGIFGPVLFVCTELDCEATSGFHCASSLQGHEGPCGALFKDLLQLSVDLTCLCSSLLFHTSSWHHSLPPICCRSSIQRCSFSVGAVPASYGQGWSLQLFQVAGMIFAISRVAVHASYSGSISPNTRVSLDRA